MKSLRFTRLSKILGVMFVCAALASAFISCNPNIGVLEGTWVSSYGEKYIIDTQTKTFENKYGDSVFYAGNELQVVYTDDSSGYIYIKYTRSMNADYSYSDTAPDVGKYYAIAFKDLTDSSVSLSGAYKTDGRTSCDTLKEAKTEFTIANGYFTEYSECTK